MVSPGGDPGHPQWAGLFGRHGAVRQAPLALLNEVLGLKIGRPPADSTFRYLFVQLDVHVFEALRLEGMSQHSCLVWRRRHPGVRWQDASRLDPSEAWCRSNVHCPGESVFQGSGRGARRQLGRRALT